MNRTELVSVLSEETNISKKDVNAVIDSLAKVVAQTLKNGEKVVLTGLGTFEVRQRIQREGRNPRTGATITIPALKTPAFKAGKTLKEALR